jgi:hypothetical protein
MNLGKHTNDHMVSFYLRTPSGFNVEYGWGAREMDDATWQVQVHTAHLGTMGQSVAPPNVHLGKGRPELSISEA